MATTGYNLRSREGEEGPQNDGDRQVELVVSAEVESVSEGSAVSVADQMALLQIKLKIAESQLETERLRNQGNAGATHVMRASSLSGEEDRRLKYTNMLKGVLLDMPSEEALVPGWFDDVEATLDAYSVPGEWRAGLLLPRLNERARGLLVRLSAEQRKDYAALKEAVLKGLRLSSAEYRRLFNHSKKGSNESWAQFATRVQNYFVYYINTFNIVSLEQLRELVVVDKVKDVLSPEARAFIIQNETTGKALLLDELANLAEQFEESQIAKGCNSGVTEPRGGSAIQARNQRTAADSTRARYDDSGRLGPNNRARRQCYACNSPDHLFRECPKRRSPRENLVQTTADDGLVARVAGANFEIGNVSGRKRPFRALKTIALGCGKTEFVGHLDSGAEVSVIKRSVLKDHEPLTGSRIKLTGAFGEQVLAELVYVPLRLLGMPEYVGANSAGTEVLCAVTDRLAPGIDALITPDMHAQLLDEAPRVPAAETALIGSGSDQGGDDTAVAAAVASTAESCGASDGALGDSHADDTERGVLRRAQLDDSTLRDAWEQAKVRSHGMIEKDGLLHHKDEVLGRPCLQLVLPESRRVEVLRLGHDSAWAGHLGERKTLQRIKGAFYWPGMTADIKRYCQSCRECQMKSRMRTDDRVPIVPITRPDTPFQVVNMDCIGPIEPPSSRGHRYALCVIDLCTRWPEVVCLRTLTAKATCDALLCIFSRMGVPETVCSDQGTNFTACLTQEFLARMGATPRFSTPEHPQSNGIVERFNGTFKGMLFEVIQTHGRDWDRYVPFLLWAYREVPNATTGESPFEMMYGRVPVGPLTILQKTWSGEWAVPDGLNTPAEQYLRELRDKLTVMNERATASAEVTQARYSANYNRRAKQKHFQRGEKVLIQGSDSAGKFAARWVGPANVVQKERPYSYLVEAEDGSRRSVRANRLRPYVTRVNAVGVIFEEDEEFGGVPASPSLFRSGRSQVRLEVDHLNEKQKGELRALVEKHVDTFSETPGRCTVGMHRIRLRKDDELKRAYAYRVPLTLRDEVDRQVSELTEWGLIYPTESGFAHPVVCVAKKDGGVRLCVDYRRLNAATEQDAFPMERATELLYQVAGSKYITVLDMLRGYWQIPLDPAAQEYTAFVTHRGQYAWRVMPYGLKNSGATFQRIMNEILTPHQEYACAYIDDVAVHSQTWEEHLEHLSKVLSAISAAGLTANSGKCKFAQHEVKYLGHIVGSGTHAPDPNRVAALRECPRPTTKRELRSFLGLANYYREYVPNYSAIVLPLTDLTNRRVPSSVPWTAAADKAFEAVKQCLAEAPVLFAPDYNKEYVLAADASEFAVGACLSQFDAEGRERPVAFLSKKLSPTQRRWATIEREAYAIIWALQRMETWLFGATIKVITDHNPLKFLTLTSPQSARLTRWALALQKFNVMIVHKAGSLNSNADALSRLVAPAP